MAVAWTGRTVVRAGSLGVCALGGLGAALAQEAVQPAKSILAALPSQHAAWLVVFTALVIFATVLSLLYLGERARWARRERAYLAEVAALRSAQARAELVLNAERQVVVTWAGRGEPVIEGNPGLASAGAELPSLLAFRSWLQSQDAIALEQAVETLRTRGTGFRTILRGTAGQYVEALGQAVTGRAILRLRETSEERRELTEQRNVLDEARRGLAALAGLLDAIPQPVWHRARDGSLAFVNAAYVQAVEGGTREATLAAATELLDRGDREQVARAVVTDRPLRLSGVVTGERRILDVTESPVENGRVGIAIDVSDLESAHSELERHLAAHVRTLDQLPTAVAMFDAGQRLIFSNAAYQKLWDLDTAFLDGNPRDGEILDRLRADRKLPEQADFRTWKADVLAAYRALGPTESPWYLPDGRSLRVIADPNPQGGLTYLYQDVSENLKLASDYSRMMTDQADTLDTLKEPVARFGSDGRLTVANKAFQALWRIDAATIMERPRIDAVIATCSQFTTDPAPWNAIRATIAGLAVPRESYACRLEVLDGTVLDCTAQPLTAGATLLTFIDVTASVNVERHLTEKNEALERASQLRDTFVHHVSYELRSPLTNIIGFAQLLGVEAVGGLNDKQREYTDHITRSSTALLVIINDILDLASIDAGSLELQYDTVDVRETVEAALRGIEDRLAESRIMLERDLDASVGSFEADGKRVRQVLFNLLSNAVGFSEEGQTVRVDAWREDDDIVLRVTDKGRGIPPEVVDRVFDRFESHTSGTKHRGVGLGLSIVRSFVELHGGRVMIESKAGIGTQVTCVFPAKAPEGHRDAAE